MPARLMVDIEALEARWHLASSFVRVITGGAGGADRGNALAIDRGDNAIVAGVFNQTVDFDPSPGTTTLTAPSTDSAFIAKYSGSGSILWAKGFGGSGEQNIQGVAVDAHGNVYAAGYFSGKLDFDPGSGTTSLAARGKHDAFVLKLNASGQFQWARGLGGSGDEGCTALAVDSSGNVLALGMFNSNGDYDPGTGTRTLSTHGSFDVSLTKLNSAGKLIYAVAVGSAGEDFGNGVSAGPSDTAVIAGSFSGTIDLDPGAGTRFRASAGGKDVFVVSLGPAGNYRFSRTVGGTGNDQAGDLRIDHDGNAVAVGQFTGKADFGPTSAATVLTSAGSTDAFVMKLSVSGTTVWARRIGGSSADRATNVEIDASNRVLVTGQFTGNVDFDPGTGAASLRSVSGSADLFALGLTASGNYEWARATGGSGSTDVGEAIGVGSNGHVYVVGTFAGTADFDPGSSIATRTATGSSDWLLWELE